MEAKDEPPFLETLILRTRDYGGCDLCRVRVVDALFPPYGLIAWLAPASPWPLGGSLVLTGLAMFTLGGFVLGTVYGGAWGFWNDRLGMEDGAPHRKHHRWYA